MDYYQLKSILSSNKRTFSLTAPSDSFRLAGPATRAYIEPIFGKILFEAEKPTVILVSAIGATGKSALAQQLSRDIGLPMLDLGKHKPVGADTLTGLLTSAFNLADIGAVFTALANGTYGIIVDAIDEGRSKTTAKAFEAFLDDIVKLCRASTITSFMLLGRTQVLDECWEYLTNQSVQTALITIEPFGIDGAKKYVDEFTEGMKSPFSAQYAEVRDYIITKLGKAFLPKPATRDDEFLSFIGYPPVLDAIVTLLKGERNYHKLLEDLKADAGGPVEIGLLRQISEYVLDRERTEKVLQNIIGPITQDAPEVVRLQASSDAFLPEEQSARLIAHCLDQSLNLSIITEPTLNKKYEELLPGWIREHPFIKGDSFQNAVFEALSVAHLIASRISQYHELVKEYLSSHKSSYHLLYMLDSVSGDHKIEWSFVNDILSSAMEFRSRRSIVELHVNGPEAEDNPNATSESGEVDIEIEILVGDDPEPAKAFLFRAEASPGSRLVLGPRLAGAFVTIPCDVYLNYGQEMELTSPIEINAKSIYFDSHSLIVRPSSVPNDSIDIILNAHEIGGNIASVSANGVDLSLMVDSRAGMFYQLIPFAVQRTHPPNDPLLKEKYLRLRRILLEFRSHSRGSLAKYKNKIEAERVVRNDLGWAILERLKSDGILTLKGSHYHLDPQKMSDRIGITWQDLRRGIISNRLTIYLQSVA